MKRLTTILAALLISAATFAQAPQGFSYQAVVRDAQNAIVANQTVEVTVTILQGADANAAKAVFSEKHSAKTNANGLFTLTIGSVDAAKFAAINWADGNLFLKAESEYGTATTQLLSVPFAMYAAKAGSADIDLSEYAKKTDIPAEANLEGYAKTADVDSIYAKKSDIPVVPTVPTKISDLENDSNFLTEHQSLAAYAKTADVDSIYAKKSDIPETVDLSGYYSKTEVETMLNALKAKIPEMVANGIANNNALESGDVVDLGLTSGTLWGTRNLGATNPQDCGDYYAWGETEPYYTSQNPLTWKDGKTGYNWANYTKLSGGSKTTITKYNTKVANGTVDSLTTLEPVDDAATATLGSGWAMPTTEEFQELYNECYWEWTTDYNGTGVEGYIVYKSADKTMDIKRIKSSDHEYSTATDTHIFLPAKGRRYDTARGDGGAGYFWSVSLTGTPSYARILYFQSTFVDSAAGIGAREQGYAVRPVRRP